ncbi:hypothetical protein Lal_00032677 [Lupinus albus]|uniref:Putative WD40/YVTN repeat-like-containing domain-containing protein n=1 Tax=Lupinus albus TaxID=3870 RepID=A0A6A4R9C8_LUPAL|nr:putative WD40/YVTN repeat-like-containing domain-containing protein [Lupinus albus]KAF1897915.1 hypothetical protein Lal_00032677 [Lupinus albus]
MTHILFSISNSRRFRVFSITNSRQFSERGNQREKDRERAQARGAKSKQKDDGLTPEQRRERDAKALQEKTAKKAAQAAGGSNAGDGGSKK